MPSDLVIFTNASGLTKNGQDNKMSTRDIFTLSKAIIEKYPEVLEYAKTTVLEQPSRNFKKESTIPLVGQVEGVDGLKTGHTDEAGYCLVSTMKIKKGETEFRVISVLMGAKTKADRAQYMKDMLNYAKQNIETRKIVDSEKFVKKVETKSASQGFIELVPKENLERASMKGINYVQVFVTLKRDTFAKGVVSRDLRESITFPPNGVACLAEQVTQLLPLDVDSPLSERFDCALSSCKKGRDDFCPYVHVRLRRETVPQK